jgi:tripartite ATP-independent transporter DctM subunit
MTGVIILLSFLLLTILTVPIIFGIATSGIIGMQLVGFGDSLFIVPQQLLEGVNSSALVAIPFFILAGNLMNALGMTDRIFSFATALVGHLRGGLAQVNIVSSLIFSGISGAAVADCAALGTVEVKAMRERGYKADFAASITAASSIIGPIFPPSIPLLIYAFVASESVGRLFLAGIVPALTITAALMIYVRIIAAKHNLPVEEKAPFSEVLRYGTDGVLAVAAPGIILVCLLTGVATASEAGVITCVYTLVLGVYYRTFTWTNLKKAFKESVLLTGIVVLMLGFSTIVAWVMAISQVPQTLAVLVLDSVSSPWAFILIYILFFLLLGTVFDTLAAMVVLLPVVLPIADAMGFDRVHFGIITIFTLMIGILTPPLGIALYIMMDIAKQSFEQMARAIIPFLVPLMIALLVVAYVPALSLFLPDLIMGTR